MLGLPWPSPRGVALGTHSRGSWVDICGFCTGRERVVGSWQVEDTFQVTAGLAPAELSPLFLFTCMPVCALGHSGLPWRIPMLGTHQAPLMVGSQALSMLPLSPCALWIAPRNPYVGSCGPHWQPGSGTMYLQVLLWLLGTPG